MQKFEFDLKFKKAQEGSEVISYGTAYSVYANGQFIGHVVKEQGSGLWNGYDEDDELVGLTFTSRKELAEYMAKRVLVRTVWNGGSKREQNKGIPKELLEITDEWYQLSSQTGDKGSCVLGAKLMFWYNGTPYFTKIPLEHWVYV